MDQPRSGQASAPAARCAHWLRVSRPGSAERCGYGLLRARRRSLARRYIFICSSRSESISACVSMRKLGASSDLAVSADVEARSRAAVLEAVNCAASFLELVRITFLMRRRCTLPDCQRDNSLDQVDVNQTRCGAPHSTGTRTSK